MLSQFDIQKLGSYLGLSSWRFDFRQTTAHAFMHRILHDSLGQIRNSPADRSQATTPYLATLSADHIVDDVLGHLVCGLAARFLLAPSLVPDVLPNLLVVRVLWQYELPGVCMSVCATEVSKYSSYEQHRTRAKRVA